MGHFLFKICKYFFRSKIPDKSNSNNYTHKLYLYFICINLFLLNAIINAQEWIDVNPSFEPSGNYNMSLGTFVDENNGWFTEPYPGRIWHTTDGGITWEMQKDSSNVWVYDIAFVDNLRGWIVGKTVMNYTPFLWRTIKGGKSWEEKLTPEFYTLTFFDISNGFAGGDSVYRTTDGGQSWQAQTVQDDAYFTVLDIYFVDEQYGWAVGSSSEITDAGIILNSTDGGESWKVNQHPTITGSAVYFLNPLKGFIVGDLAWGAAIMMTQDGGENWEVQYLNSPPLLDLAFMDNRAGWAVGYNGYLWYTEDSGSTWERIETNTNADLNKIVFVDNGNVGYIFGENNTLLRYDKTTDVKEDGAVAPSMFKLYQNYPNPFNPETVIAYELKRTAFVILKLYDLTGKEVMTLVNEKQTGGRYQVVWNGRNKYGKEVNSGIYFYQLKTDSFNQTRKMILIR